MKKNEHTSASITKQNQKVGSLKKTVGAGYDLAQNNYINMKISQLQSNREIIVKLLREKIVQYKMELEIHYILSQKARKVANILYHIHSASIVNQNSKLLIIVSKILKKKHL